MERIRCFLIKATPEVEVYLRRYRLSQKDVLEAKCPDPYGYHTASVLIGREPAQYDEQGYICNGIGKKNAVPHDDPRWPTRCACGYTFQEEDEWQKDVHQIYRREDTGEEYILRNVPPGAMWEAWWLDSMHKPQGPHNLMVKTPGGEWAIDSQASNCTLKEDYKQEKHHCWVRTGTPPNVTVGKDGPTCSAGAGSIQCGSYHGFLRNGWLES